MGKIENKGRIKVFLKDKNKKNLFKIAKELWLLKKAKNERPYYYFKYLYRKDVTNILDYLGAKEMNLIRKSKRLHNPELYPIFNNKLLFCQLFDGTAIRTPKLLSHNYNNTFSFGNTTTDIRTLYDCLNFFTQRFNEENIESIFFRPHSDYGGHGCFMLTKKDLKTELPVVLDHLLNGDFVHTAGIDQHPEINKIHAASVNTIRLITLVTSSNSVEVVYAGMRFGVGNSVVDNASSGGFFTGIDITKGTLNDTGHYLIEYGGKNVYRHPDNGYDFRGFKVPYFNEACDLVIKAVGVLPDGLIGWDIAITANGPTIVEANDMPHLHSSDVACGGLLKNTHMKQLIAELKHDKEQHLVS
ncbi:MAG: hypothetical protein HKN40_03110 [Winogradskyella sp.]|uniref:sugar-transfer associated ATP-grasp domain-containing protein n=1 Tax=Winogradskyella sp. TaxID=1883156 RepID=UPI001804B60D|nr:hypothetical protein [Winogradskyella sp.]